MERFFVRGVRIAEGTGDVLAEIDVSAEAPVPHYYVSNHRGDTVVTLTDAGTVDGYRHYEAFGAVLTNIGTFTPLYTFSTKEYLPDAKLHIYAYRVYDPVAGRWTQRDPIDYQDSVNLYCFCGNNPVNRIDLWGLKLFGVFVRGHSYNPFGHALIKHVDDKTEIVTYYDVNVKLDRNGNIVKDAKGHYIFECQRYTQEEFNKKYGSASTMKEAEVSDITDENAVLSFLQDKTGSSYPYQKVKNNCVTYANNALEIGGHTVVDDGSYAENARRYPSDWIDGIQKQNRDRRKNRGAASLP